MTTALARRRGGRGLYTKLDAVQQLSDKKSRKPQLLPEYLIQEEVNALLRSSPHPRARMVMLLQWRAGLRISEALGLEYADLQLQGERATLKVRWETAKGAKERVVPVHPELRLALENWPIQRGRLVDATPSTAWRWVKEAQRRAESVGALAVGKSIGTHTLRHSFARHVLASGVPINRLQVWLGHSSLQTTLIYLQLVPDAMGMIERVP
jgi:integrase/recombinase XerD